MSNFRKNSVLMVQFVQSNPLFRGDILHGKNHYLMVWLPWQHLDDIIFNLSIKMWTCQNVYKYTYLHISVCMSK